MCVRLGLTGRHRTPVGPLLVDTPGGSLETRAMGSIAEVQRKLTLLVASTQPPRPSTE